MAFVDFEGTAKFAKIFEHNRDMGENLEDGDQKTKILSEQGHYILNVYITPETKKEMIAAAFAVEVQNLVTFEIKEFTELVSANVCPNTSINII